MKQLANVLLTLALATNVQASNSDEMKEAISNNADMCTLLSLLAEKVMENRQDGVPMRKQMEKVNKADESIVDILTEFVTEAYDVSQYGSDEYQRRAITEFGNSALLTCLKVKGRG